MLISIVRRDIACGVGLPQRENTALICAAENGHSNCVRLLLDAGADKEAKDVVREFL